MMHDYVERLAIGYFLLAFGGGFAAGCLVVCGLMWLLGGGS